MIAQVYDRSGNILDSQNTGKKKGSPFPCQVSVNRVVKLAPIGARDYDRVMNRDTGVKSGKAHRHGIVLEQGQVVNLISAMGGF